MAISPIRSSPTPATCTMHEPLDKGSYPSVGAMLNASKELRKTDYATADQIDEVDEMVIETMIEALGHPDISSLDDLMALSSDCKVTIREVVSAVSRAEVTICTVKLSGKDYGVVLGDDSARTLALIDEGDVLVQS